MKRRRLVSALTRRFGVALLAFPLVVLALSAFEPARAAVDFRVLIQQHVDLQNQGDIAGVMATLSDDAVLSGLACAAPPCIGKAAIQREIERRVSIHAQLKITSLRETSSGSGVGRLEIQSDLFPPCGVQRIVVTFNVDVKDDKITSFASRPDTLDAQTATFLACIATTTQTPAPTVAPPRTGDAGLVPSASSPQPTAAAGLAVVVALSGALALVLHRQRSWSR